MRKSSLFATLVIGFPFIVASANAADVSLPLDDWSGFYLGAGANWNFLSTRTYSPTQDTEFGGTFDGYRLDDQSANAFGGSIQAGYDHQFDDFVFGVQLLGSLTDVEDEAENPSDPDEIHGVQMNSFLTLTGRLGFLIQPQLLAYAKGGFVTADFDYSDENKVRDFWGSQSEWRNGWTVGGGLEYKFAPNWSMFAEYNYSDFGEETIELDYKGSGTSWGDTFEYDYDQNFSTVTLGVNYRF